MAADRPYRCLRLGSWLLAAETDRILDAARAGGTVPGIQNSGVTRFMDFVIVHSARYYTPLGRETAITLTDCVPPIYGSFNVSKNRA